MNLECFNSCAEIITLPSPKLHLLNSSLWFHCMNLPHSQQVSFHRLSIDSASGLAGRCNTIQDMSYLILLPLYTKCMLSTGEHARVDTRLFLYLSSDRYSGDNSAESDGTLIPIN